MNPQPVETCQHRAIYEASFSLLPGLITSLFLLLCYTQTLKSGKKMRKIHINTHHINAIILHVCWQKIYFLLYSNTNQSLLGTAALKLLYNNELVIC